jgi:DNA repair photolyase
VASGTKEWAEINHNIGKGCANDCLYCYAAAMAANPFFGAWRQRCDWSREELAHNAHKTSYPLKRDMIMFPTTHDITPFYLPHFIRVATMMLGKGNRLLITTKPRLECVTELLAALAPFRDRVLFRFTVGSLDDGDVRFWEPNAPLPAERMAALDLACVGGWQTSVSIEPMLAGRTETLRVIRAVYPLVTETIWVGKMRDVRRRVDMGVPEHAAAVAGIEVLQCDAAVLGLVAQVERLGLLKVRWKDSVKAIMNVE